MSHMVEDAYRDAMTHVPSRPAEKGCKTCVSVYVSNVINCSLSKELIIEIIIIFLNLFYMYLFSYLNMLLYYFKNISLSLKKKNSHFHKTNDFSTFCRCLCNNTFCGHTGRYLLLRHFMCLD